MRKYSGIAKKIIQSDDPGGELLKLLEAIDVELIPFGEVGILITQAVPEGDEPNPIVHIAVFTNKETDFPAETQERFDAWITEVLESLKKK